MLVMASATAFTCELAAGVLLEIAPKVSTNLVPMFTALWASSKTAHMSTAERPLFGDSPSDEMSLIVRVIWLAANRSSSLWLRHSLITTRKTPSLSAYKVLRASVVAASWRGMHLSYIQVNIASGDHASPGSGRSLAVSNLGMPEASRPSASMEKPSQWVSKMCRLFFADEYARRTAGVPTAAQVPDLEPAFKAAQNILPNLEARIIEFLSGWLVTFLMPAKHVLDTRAPHLYFMFSKEHWFRELYLGLKVTASFDRSESYTRIIDGQVRCITPDFKPKDLQVAWNVQFITVFVPAWMIPPIYHSLHRESIKNTNSASAIGVKSVRPTWFEDIVTSREPAQPEPMHGLKLVIKEEALPLKEQPEFPAPAELAKRGFRSWRMELQTSANQLESHNWCTNAWHNHWTKWRWTPRTVAYASRLAPAYWRSCPTKLRPSRHNLAGAWQFAWGTRPEERLSRNQPQSTPMVSQHCVEQTIYGAKGQVSPYHNCGRTQSQPSHWKHPPPMRWKTMISAGPSWPLQPCQLPHCLRVHSSRH